VYDRGRCRRSAFPHAYRAARICYPHIDWICVFSALLFVGPLLREVVNALSRRKIAMRHATNYALITCLLLLSACSPRIYGTLQLMDPSMQPIPPAKESPEGTVVNMINTTSTLEQASHAVAVNVEGKFESEKGKLAPGVYKVETSRIGFMTDTQTMEITKFGSKKVEINLRKIAEGKRKSIEGSRSDEDKIVNPGEVNIQPPTM
jgi:hypothetical protein